jgi:hypothetical protein
MLTKSQLRVTRPLFLFLIIFLSATIARAVSVSEYQQNLKRAITALDTLTQSDEDESESDYRTRFVNTLTMVRTAMPESQMVDSGEELCTVDNAWLHDQLKDLERASDAEWLQILTHIVEQLKAVDERITEFLKADIKDWNKSAAKERLAGILDRPEYAKQGRASSAFARIMEAIARWIAKLFGRRPQTSAGGSEWISFIARALVVVLAMGLIFFVIKLLLPRFSRRRKKQEKVKLEPRIVLGERLEPDASTVDLLAEAEALARSGQIRAAIRKAYIALLVELGDRKVISLAHHKTNRDYLRSVRNIPPLYSVMSGLTDSFERHWYGLVQADARDWQSFRDAYMTAVHTRTS